MPLIRANDDACAQLQTKLREEFGIKGFYHSIELPDGRVLEGILKIDKLRERLAALPIPMDLRGKRVLDIGTWDGYFAFEMEKRGAEVMAIDNVEQENFHVAHELMNSRVDYRVMDVYELSPERVGCFDYVLFLGVLYHLKHPLLGLERVCSVTREMAIVESFVTDETIGGQPTMEFYETDDLLGEVDNWVGPNQKCMIAFCRTAGFVRPALLEVKSQRAAYACYRQWEPEPELPLDEAPQLNAAVHTVNYGINFDSARDHYVSAFFKTHAADLTLDAVMPVVDQYAVRPVAVVRHGADGVQANFRLPLGLDPGWHEVRVRTANSRFSNPVRIAVDLPARAESLVIAGACDAATSKPNELAPGEERALSIWITGLPENADRHNVSVRLGGAKMDVNYMAPADSGATRQVNASMRRALRPGDYALTVGVGGISASALSIRVL